MKTYLDYLTQVLGVESVMMPAPLRVMDAQVPAIAKPRFFYDANGGLEEGVDFQKCDLAIVNWIHDASESLFDQKVADLFGKMLQAMKLPAEKVLVLDCVMNDRNLIPNELFKICDPKFVLFFSQEPQNLSEMQLRGSANWLETLSPAYLLKEASSKKLVWNDMQKIMKDMQKENSWNS